MFDTVKAGDKLLLSIGTTHYSVISKTSCNYVVKLEKVSFFNGTNLLGTSEQAPFNLEWTLQPGKDGLPASGSGQIVITAVAQTGYTSVELPLKFEP